MEMKVNFSSGGEKNGEKEAARGKRERRHLLAKKKLFGRKLDSHQPIFIKKNSGAEPPKEGVGWSLSWSWSRGWVSSEGSKKNCIASALQYADLFALRYDYDGRAPKPDFQSSAAAAMLISVSVFFCTLMSRH